MPFSRVTFKTEEGLLAMGQHKNVSLLPENIYDIFNNFSERGSKPLYLINKATSYWKAMAIYSHLPSFTLNNLVGDTWMAAVQHPRPDRLIGAYTTAIEHLLGRSKADPRMQRLSSWLTDQDIKFSFTRSEVELYQSTSHPLGALMHKMNSVSDARENLNRVAYAATLFDAMEAGEGRAMVEAHDWIDTTGLSISDALGKIAREVLVDYSKVSKTWRRWMSGMLFPFSTFYAKWSANAWKFLFKHPIKGLSVFLALPVAATVYNNRSKEVRELEAQLPDYVRSRVHFVLGKNPDGTIRTISPQFPQDVLIGTKVFSVATDYANRVVNGEMSPPEAAKEFLKAWGFREVEGVAYLTGPWIRFFRGYAEGRDPYDKSPVYSLPKEQLTETRKARDLALYFIKTSVPFLGASIQAHEKGLPQDVALRRVIDQWAGKGALGIYDVTPDAKVQIVRDGKKITMDWDTVQGMREISRREFVEMGDLSNAFVDSGQLPKDFIKSKAYKKHLARIYDGWAKVSSDLPKSISTEQKVSVAQNVLGKRLVNKLLSPRIVQKWYTVKQARAKTDEEKRQLAEQYKDAISQQRIIDAIKSVPRSARALQLMEIAESISEEANDVFGEE